MRFLLIYLLLGSTLCTVVCAQSVYGSDPFAHTYSIVARDPVTGEMGVAVQSHWFSVGTVVSWGEAGVGVIATQSLANPSFGPRGLALLKAGLTAQQALDALIAGDEGRAVRQVAILDAHGNVAVHTGSNCVAFAGHIRGDNYAVQANLMRSDKVWPAMAKAFEESEGPLAERLLGALEAAESAGGDIRGRQSAAILVVASKSTGQSWVDRTLDLHVEDHAHPLQELRRLYDIHRAYAFMNKGDVAIEYGDVNAALAAYGAAQALFPENEEMQYWHAVSLANIGRIEDALGVFKKVFLKNPDWREVTPRIVQAGLLKLSKGDLERVMQLR